MNQLASRNVTGLSPFEWNFGPVPGAELDICFLYEYAREHAKQSKRWHELTNQLHTYKPTKRGRKNKSKSAFELGREISSIFGKVNFTDFFCDRAFITFYEPAFVTTPWQSVDGSLRRKAAKQFNQQKSGAQSFCESISLFITLQRDLPEYAPAGATDFDSWVLLDRCFHHEEDREKREYGFFAINWNYTDGQLIDEFKKWLAEKRGDRRASASQQGKSKRRQYLKALGAKRLLDSSFTVPKAMEYTQKFLKDENGNPYLLYDSERGWSKAKNETVPAILKLLFPAHK